MQFCQRLDCPRQCLRGRSAGSGGAVIFYVIRLYLAALALAGAAVMGLAVALV